MVILQDLARILQKMVILQDLARRWLSCKILQDEWLSCKILASRMVILQDSCKSNGYLARFLQVEWLSCKIFARRWLSCKILQENLARRCIVLQDLARILQDLAR